MQQLALRFNFPVFIFGYAGRLFKDLAAVLRFRTEYTVDFSLANDGVSIPSQSRIHKKLVDVLEPAKGFIDIILPLAAAVHPPGNRNLRKIQRKIVIGIVQRQRDLREAQGFPGFRTRENHILHFAAAEGLDALFPHDPADGVRNVAFSGAVWSDNGGDSRIKVQVNFVGKGLKPLHFDTLQPHIFYPLPSCFRMFFPSGQQTDMLIIKYSINYITCHEFFPKSVKFFILCKFGWHSIAIDSQSSPAFPRLRRQLCMYLKYSALFVTQM